VANRIQIFDDAVSLVLAGRLNIDIAFNISEYLLSEDDPIVWISSERNLRGLLNSPQMSQYSIFTYYKKKVSVVEMRSKEKLPKIGHLVAVMSKPGLKALDIRTDNRSVSDVYTAVND